MAELETEEAKKKREEAEKKKRERELLLALFLLLLQDTHAHLISIFGKYISGGSSIHTVQRNMITTLLGAHAHAAWMGRRLGGVATPPSPQDQLFGQTVMMGQAPYIKGLVDDLQAGKWAGKEPTTPGGVPAGLVQRLGWYANRVRGTADEAFVLSLPPETEYNWITTAHESCDDCIEMEATSPHDGAHLTRFPGSGQTECVMNCRCYLETTDGRRGFQL